MKSLTKQVFEFIEAQKYNLSAEYCHPENVSDSALEIAEQSADKHLCAMSRLDIVPYTLKAIEEHENTTILNVIHLIINDNFDNSGHETITVTVTN